MKKKADDYKWKGNGERKSKMANKHKFNTWILIKKKKITRTINLKN